MLICIGNFFVTAKVMLFLIFCIKKLVKNIKKQSRFIYNTYFYSYKIGLDSLIYAIFAS